MMKKALSKLLQRCMAVALLVATGAASAQAQAPRDSTVNKKRLHALAISSAVAYAATLTGLHQIWYKDAERQSFQFFNDLDEWKQTDKLGHFYSSFYFSYATSRTLRWANVQPRKADVIGAATGFLVLLPIEIFDGFSDAYGASVGDLVANGAGAGFFAGQQLLWREVRILPKFSFSRTSFAPRRPEVLGDGLISELIKDYNGQTYWLSFDLDKFMKAPGWLNLAIGYGANDMLYARDGSNREAGFDPFRQYYLSIDLDLSGIRTRSKAVRTLIFLAGMIKIPTPTLELSRKGARMHAFHF